MNRTLSSIDPNFRGRRSNYTIWPLNRLGSFCGGGYSPVPSGLESGTVMVTTANAVGRFDGWILPSRNMHNIALSFESISKKPWVVDDKIQLRDILHLNVSFNHDAIDGVPAPLVQGRLHEQHGLLLRHRHHYCQGPEQVQGYLQPFQRTG